MGFNSGFKGLKTKSLNSVLLHVSNIVCSSSGRPSAHEVLYGMFFMHLCIESSRWKDVSQYLHYLYKYTKDVPYKTSLANGLPDDEHMLFETCRRRQELMKTLI